LLLRYPEQFRVIQQTTGQKFERLVEIMARLRAPGGCPWDREQTFDTIKPYLVEETYEVLEAIDEKNWSGLAEELGDLVLQAVFFAEMAAEAGHFRIDDSLDAISEKLIRRHPHIFGEGSAKTADDVKKRWDEIKKEEKAARGQAPKTLLGGVPRNLPALVEAERLTLKAAGVGFDWSSAEQVLDKLHEELDELAEARQDASPAAIEDELGDLLFVVVNLARFLKIDPEQALRKTNAKFRRRFGYIERNAALPGAPLEEMEALWQQAKLEPSAQKDP
jgi:MazG family protein